MAEYWKSTPKYWCKFCEVYVKDTKFERQQHEATGRHKGAIQRSLRGLHRKQENETREKQRAKDEIARLNGLVPGSGSPSASSSTPVPGDARVGAKPTFTRGPNRVATVEDRKKQLQQLADMGVAVPEQHRGEMAMAGEWRVVSERVIGEEEKKPMNTGVHKRKLDEHEEEQIAAGEVITKRKGWGNTYKSFPGKMGGDDDIEALFKKVKKPTADPEPETKEEDPIKQEDLEGVKEEGNETMVNDIPTKEEAAATAISGLETLVKEEDDVPAPAVVFKKRKKIAR